MKSLDDLCNEAIEGKLSQEDLHNVVKQIEVSTPDSDKDLYDLLDIVGRGGFSEYRNIVEKFLYYPTNPEISRKTLTILCSYWGLTENYLKEMKAFIRGVEWDPHADIRTVAIRAAGTYLRYYPEKELFQLLIQIFENEMRVENENTYVKDAVCDALSRAVGKEWDEITENDGRVDYAVITKAREIVAQLD